MNQIRLTTSSGNSPSLAGRIFGSLFCLVFLVGGILVSGLIIRDTSRRLASRSWKPVPCVILTSEIKRDPNYTFVVSYGYTMAGREYTGHQITIGYHGSSDYAEAQRLLETFPADFRSSCYVDPKNPSEAILQRPGLGGVGFLLFPIPFLGIGLGGLYWLWRRTGPGGTSTTAPLSGSASSNAGKNGLAWFFAVFLMIGLVALYWLFIKPLGRVIAAQNWPGIPCTVISSEVRSHSSDDGNTYSVDILYAYEFKGKEYRSNRYHFMPGSTSGYEGKAAIVRQYPPGRQVTCFVNPHDPVEAVLVRGTTATFWFGLFPLIFVAVGAGGILYAKRGGSWQGETQVIRFPRSPYRAGTAKSALTTAGTALPGEFVELKPRFSPKAKFIGAIVVALFWNGIVSIFVREVVQMWRRGETGISKWFLTVFLIPFVGIGVFLIGAIGHSFLALFSPRPRLKSSATTIPLGGSLDLQWTLDGRLDNLREFRLFLEGREEATYRRGTTTSTDKSTFATIELTRITDPQQMRSGRVSVTIPITTMPTFTAPHNKILWAIRLKANIPKRPDLDEEYPLTILPLPSDPAPSA